MERLFNEEEQRLIESICFERDSNTYVIATVFQEWLYRTPGVRYVFRKKYLEFDHAIHIDSDEILTIRKKIISTALLIKYLEERGYIYIIEDQLSSNGLSYVGAEDIKESIRVDLPKDIARILERSFYNIYVSNDLVQLVRNGFATPEEMLLKATNSQAEKIAKQTAQLEAQRQATLELVDAALIQTKETRKQTQLAEKQSQEAFIQSEEAKKQTKLAQDQTEEAQKQREEAQEQTKQALIQTEEAKKQTKFAQDQTEEAKKQTSLAQEQTNEAKKQTDEAQKQTKYSFVVLVLAIISLLCAGATVWFAHKQRQDALKYNEIDAERQVMVDSAQTQVIQSIDENTLDIKNNIDTLIHWQIETNQSVHDINTKINSRKKN